MSGIKYLKDFDKRQLWRFFVDGRYQKKYEGWIGYEGGERGSVQALMNGFAFMLENFDLSRGLKSTYLLDLHKICMLGVETANLKSSPGDLRFLNAGMPFFAKSTTKENIQEILKETGDGTAIFNSKKYGKTADEFNAQELYDALLKEGSINYRNWYPNLDKKTSDALNKQNSLQEFYLAKHYVQSLFAYKMDEIVTEFNKMIKKAKTDEEKLDAFVFVTRRLELLHPFPDGNCRTFACINLNHLLLYYGFCPTILYNPNYDGELSSAQFKEEIKKGMELFKNLLENSSATIYNYSIEEMPKESVDRFLLMAQKTVEKIYNIKEIYITPKIFEKLSGCVWKNCPDEVCFGGVGDYGTFRAGDLYFLFSADDWEKEGKNLAKEIEKLYEKGIRAFVTDRKSIFEVTSMPIALVESLKKCYFEVAQKVRFEVNPKTILVTGTEGKTGAKTMLWHILNPQTKAHANINSANTEIPVLRSLINLSFDDAVEINEVSVGADENLRVQRAKMVSPDICLFTNIGPNHMDLHKSIENIIWAKSSVVEGLKNGGICILNSDNDYFDELSMAIEKRKGMVSKFTYGTSATNDAWLISYEFDVQKYGWNVCARIENENVNYFIPMIQQHAPLSSVGVLLCVKKLGFDIQKAALAFETLVPFETMGRLVLIDKKGDEILFYDQSRRGGISGMKSAFEDLGRFKIGGKIIALVGGISIKKDSEWTKKAHRELAEMVNKSPIDRLFTTGNYMKYVHENLEDKSILIKHSDDIEFLANALMEEAESGDLIFIIGSAYLYLGRVADLISKKYKCSVFNHKIQKSKINNTINLDKSLLYQDFLKNSAISLENFKINIFYQFFTNISQIFMNNYGFIDVCAKITKNSKNGVFDRSKCRGWLYNGTKFKKTRGKQVFGVFFDFGDKDFLLHINFATLNIHFGVVKYTKNENGEIEILKIKDEEWDEAIAQFGFLLQKREWGFRWLSIDCGKGNDLSVNEEYLRIKEFLEIEEVKEFLNFINKNKDINIDRIKINNNLNNK